MKVLIVSHAYPPSIGGAEELARDLAEWLALRGVAARVLTTDAADSSAFVGARATPFRTGRDTRSGVEILRLPLAGGFLQRSLHRIAAAHFHDRMPANRIPILAALRWAPLILRIVCRALETRPDVIVALPMPFVTVFGAYLASRLARRPFACIPCLHPGEPLAFRRPWIRHVLSRAEAVLALTLPEGGLAIELGARPASLQVTGMGLDRAPFAQGAQYEAIPEAWGVPASGPVVLFLGRIEERKGINLLLAAMDEVAGTRPDAVLVLAGPAGRGCEAIRRAISTRPNVRYVGAIDDGAKRGLLARSRVVVLAAGRESFGRVILEAWASSRPVVVPAGSPQSSVVEDERTGLTFDPTDPKLLATAILQLVENKGLAERLGEAGRARLEADYTWDVVGERILSRLTLLARATRSAAGCRRPPFRVLFVEHVNHLGGAEIALARLIGALRRDRIAPIAVCAPGPGRLAEELAGVGCEVHRLNLVGIKPGRPLRSLLVMHELATLVRREEIDAVVLNGLRSLKAALALGGPAVPPLFCHIHDILGPENVTRSLRRARFFSERIHTFLAASHAAAVSLAGHGIPESRIRIVHEAVDPTSLTVRRDAAKVRRSLGIPNSVRVMGFVGQFDPRKGLEEFLAAAEKLLAEDPQVWAIVVGDDIFAKHGAFRREMFCRARAWGDGRIVLTGERRDVADLLGAMDVVVCPSRQDACPLVVLEAMAAGKPVVATRVGGIPEEVEDGVTGVLVGAGDPGAIAAEVGRILRSPNLAAEMGRRGKRRVETLFSLNRQARMIESILLDALLPGPLPEH